MEFYTVKEIAQMLSVNDETVRRWIRDGRLQAERGSGRQGSKVNDVSLKVFLEENKGLTTAVSAAALGIGSIGTSIASVTTPLGIVSAIGGALFGTNMLKMLKDEQQDKKEMKLELMEKEFELEKKRSQLKLEIARLQGELELLESKIEKIKVISKDIDA